MLSHLVDIQQKTEEVQISPTYNTNKFSSEKRNKERGEKQRKKQTNTERKKAETIKKKTLHPSADVMAAHDSKAEPAERIYHIYEV